MASKEILKQKEKEVADIVEKIKKSKSIILFDYRGISVLEDTALRVNLRKDNVEYKVIKNGILSRALDIAGYKGLDEYLAGPTAVAFGYEDAVTPAKILVDTTKKLNKMAVKGGLCEGKKCDANEVIALSKIPAKPVLVGQLLGLLTNPMRSLAVALSEIAKKKA